MLAEVCASEQRQENLAANSAAARRFIEDMELSMDLWGHLSEHSWRVAQVNVDEIEEREKCYIDDTTILCS